MDAKLKSTESNDVNVLMREIGQRAKATAKVLALAPSEKKSAALKAAAKAVREDAAKILQANAEDIADAKKNGAAAAFIDRLMLDQKRIDAMADGIEIIAGVPDPVGEVTAAWDRPNGLKIERVRTPLGVIAVVYESRPN